MIACRDCHAADRDCETAKRAWRLLDRCRHFGEVDGSVVEVVLSVLEDELAVGVAQLAAELAGYTGPEGVRRHDGVLGEYGAGGDDGALADAAVVEAGEAHADEAGGFCYAT